MSLYAAKQQLPGVKETVITTVFSPSHLLCSTIMFAWVSTSYRIFLCTIFVFLLKFYLRVEMGELIGLGVDPAKGFHLFKVGMLRQLFRQVHLRGTYSTKPSSASNFVPI